MAYVTNHGMHSQLGVRCGKYSIGASCDGKLIRTIVKFGIIEGGLVRQAYIFVWGGISKSGPMRIQRIGQGV